MNTAQNTHTQKIQKLQIYNFILKLQIYNILQTKANVKVLDKPEKESKI